MKAKDVVSKELSFLFKNNNVCEIRVRSGKPYKVLCGGVWQYVGEDKLIVNSHCCKIADKNEAKNIVEKACNNSLYCYEEMLAKGYLTLDDGARIGVGGELADNSGRVFKTYNSVCLRIPHFISVVPENVINIAKNKNNIIVIGAPCSGKTTFLKDIALRLSTLFNVLVVDERGEITLDEHFAEKSQCDILRWCNKKYAFEVGIKSLSPDYVICDELFDDDFNHLKVCSQSGVSVIAGCHGSSVENVMRKYAVLPQVFDYAVVLSNNSGFYTQKLVSIADFS